MYLFKYLLFVLVDFSSNFNKLMNLLPVLYILCHMFMSTIVDLPSAINNFESIF